MRDPLWAGSWEMTRCSEAKFLQSQSRRLSPSRWGFPAGAAIVFDDPLGDTFGGTGFDAHDIISIETEATGSEIVFIVSFAAEIASVDLISFIDIDTDQDSSTGVTSNQTNFGPGPSGLGIEFFIFVGELSSEVAVTDALTRLPVGFAPIVFEPTSFTVTLPTSIIGGDDGNVNYGVTVGNRSEATDVATNPDQAPAFSSTVPEPTSLLTWSLLAVGLIFYRRRRRTLKKSER